jgi:uncharacterized protein HemX
MKLFRKNTQARADNGAGAQAPDDRTSTPITETAARPSDGIGSLYVPPIYYVPSPLPAQPGRRRVLWAVIVTVGVAIILAGAGVGAYLYRDHQVTKIAHLERVSATLGKNNQHLAHRLVSARKAFNGRIDTLNGQVKTTSKKLATTRTELKQAKDDAAAQYDAGYSSGSSSGYDQGSSAGYAQGSSDSYWNGWNDGYNAGYDAGSYYDY